MQNNADTMLEDTLERIAYEPAWKDESMHGTGLLAKACEDIEKRIDLLRIRRAIRTDDEIFLRTLDTNQDYRAMVLAYLDACPGKHASDQYLLSAWYTLDRVSEGSVPLERVIDYISRISHTRFQSVPSPGSVYVLVRETLARSEHAGNFDSYARLLDETVHSKNRWPVNAPCYSGGVIDLYLDMFWYHKMEGTVKFNVGGGPSLRSLIPGPTQDDMDELSGLMEKALITP